MRRILQRHIVIDDDHRIVEFEHFRGHLELHHVARIILDDEQHPGPALDRFGGAQYLVGGGAGKDLSRTRCIEHAVSDKADVQRLMSGAPTGDQGHLAGFEIATLYESPLRPQNDDLRVCCRQTIE